MHRVFLLIGVVLAWFIVIWGCFGAAFGIADLYTVTLGGAVPGQPAWMGDAAPTVGECAAEIAIGVGLIAFALVARHRIRGKFKRAEAVAPEPNKG